MDHVPRSGVHPQSRDTAVSLQGHWISAYKELCLFRMNVEENSFLHVKSIALSRIYTLHTCIYLYSTLDTSAVDKTPFLHTPAVVHVSFHAESFYIAIEYTSNWCLPVLDNDLPVLRTPVVLLVMYVKSL